MLPPAARKAQSRDHPTPPTLSETRTPSSVGYPSALGGINLPASYFGYGAIMKIQANGSYIASLSAIVSCCALLLAELTVPSARADDVDYPKMNADACSNAIGINACANGIRPSAPTPSITFGVDPCFIAQNAMRPCNSAPQAPAQPISVDSHLLGTWYMPIANGLWVFEILSNGTYRFHSEAGDGVAPHTGSFSASDGHWSMRANTGYADAGTYLLQGTGVWITTGHLGKATWQRNPLNVSLRQ
jgi:hypothetical protein